MSGIEIHGIDHNEQRYNTVGDWFVNKFETLIIRVSKTGEEDYDFLIAIHELVEAYMCQRAGVTAEQVDAHDMNYQGSDEPGDDPTAPYYTQHQAATTIERVMSEILDVDWGKYEARLDQLSKSWRPKA